MGKKKIISMIQLTISYFKVWILDEPFTGLDQDKASILFEKMQNHINDNGTVIITSHSPKNKFKKYRTMLNKFNSIILRDMRVILNSNSRIFMPVVYLFLIITFFFSISLEGTVLGGYDKILTQIIWLSCLLVSLLNIEIMFKDDYEDGTLDRIVINSDMLEICILAKVLSHWLFSILPLVIIAFLINFLLTETSQFL